MVILDTERLVVRQWCDKDRDAMYRLNSDPAVMQFFPGLKSREESNSMFERVRTKIDTTGLGFYALELKLSGCCIGFCGLSETDLKPILPECQIEIGWRLLPEYWGRGYIGEAAADLLSYGFDVLNLKRIVAFTACRNQRSIRVMERIGMRRVENGDFDHPRVLEQYPHLRRHVLYEKYAIAA